MDIKSWTWRKRAPDNKGGDTPVINSPENHPSSSPVPPPHPQPSRFVFGDHLRISDSITWREEKPASNHDTKVVVESQETPEEVKQHAKVAEEAVAGWEKAEAETESVKRQLEQVQKEKTALQERLSHLDGALKDCTRQVRLVREEQEHKRQELLQKKNKEVERVRLEFESKLADVGRQLLEAGAENKVMAMTIQEQVRATGEVTDAKSRAEAEMKILQQRIESVEKDKGVLKYEVHVLNKQLQIRNEERVYSKRDIDTLNKQHNEDVKKMGRLEAECQRLRILVRRKLPGPNAVAQMKMEVESMDGSVDGRRRRPNTNNNNITGMVTQDVAAMHQLRQQQGLSREIELLLERLLSMEEETKMLKEALTQRNGELHTSRLMCAKTATRLSALEAYFESVSRTHGVPKPKLNGMDTGRAAAGVVTLGDENGNTDDEVSRADAWASALIAELSQFKKEKLSSSGIILPRTVDIMDDFTDMERLVDTTLFSDLTSEKTSASKAPTELTAEKMSPCKSPNCGDEEVGAPARRSLEPSFDAGKVDEATVLTESEVAVVVRRAISLVEALAQAAGVLFITDENAKQPSTELESKVRSLTALNKLTYEFVNQLLDAFDVVLSELKARLPATEQPTKVDCETQTGSDNVEVELEMVRVEKLALESHMKAELSRLAVMETELTEMKNEKLHLQLDLDDGCKELERTKSEFRDAQQLIQELQTKLVASKEEMVARAQQSHAGGSYMQDVVLRLEKELEEEYKNDVVNPTPNQPEKSCEPPPPPPPLPIQESVTDDKNIRKEQEIAEAEEKLAECQRTILALGKQLKALSSSSPTHHSVQSSMESRANSSLSMIRKFSESEGEVDSDHHVSSGGRAGVRSATQAVEDYGLSPTGSPMRQQRARHLGEQSVIREVHDYFSSMEESSSEILSTSDITSPFTQRGGGGGSAAKAKRSSFSRFFTRAKTSV